MKNIYSRLLVAFLFCFITTHAHAEAMYGVFMVVKGAVKVKNSANVESDAKVGNKIYEGDTVTTGADSRAKLVMSDRNVFNISPTTEFSLSKYKNDPKTGKKEVELNLANGKVRSNVEQAYDGTKSTFQVKTPTAVAGVRGTQFLTSFDRETQKTAIVTFKGAVTFASVNTAGQVIGKPVLVKKGETTSASPNQAPSVPKSIPKEEIKKVDGESNVSLKTPSTEGGAKRDIASDGAQGLNAAGSTNGGGSANSAGGALPPPPVMLDSRDVDTGIAKDIKDVRSAVNNVKLPTQPQVINPIDNSSINNAIRDQNAKAKVIIKPNPVTN